MEALAPMLARSPVFLLVFIRLGALFVSLPVIGARAVPVQVRVLFVLAISWALLPLVPLPRGMDFTIASWIPMAFREAVIGLSMGFLVHLVLAAVPLAGQMLGYQMGFGIATVMDPLGQQQMTMVAQLMYIFAVWLFFAMDGHHLMLKAVFESFSWAPVGSGEVGKLMGQLGLNAGRHLFESAFLLSAPVLLVMFFVQVAFGIIARTVPQMNVFIVAWPLQIGVGLLAMAAAMGFFAPWLNSSLGWLKNTLVAVAAGI